MVDGFVTGRSVEGADPFVERILSKGNRFLLFATSQVTLDGLPDDGSDAHAAAQGGVSKFAIRLLGKTKVRDDVSGHGDITISRYRQCGKWRPDPIFLRRRSSSGRR